MKRWKEWHKLHFVLSIPFFSLSKLHLLSFSISANYMEMYESRMPEGFKEKKPEKGGMSAVKLKTVYNR